jgi:hypothetical protein
VDCGVLECDTLYSLVGGYQDLRRNFYSYLEDGDDTLKTHGRLRNVTTQKTVFHACVTVVPKYFKFATVLKDVISCLYFTTWFFALVRNLELTCEVIWVGAQTVLVDKKLSVPVFGADTGTDCVLVQTAPRVCVNDIENMKDKSLLLFDSHPVY